MKNNNNKNKSARHRRRRSARGVYKIPFDMISKLSTERFSSELFWHFLLPLCAGIMQLWRSFLQLWRRFLQIFAAFPSFLNYFPRMFYAGGSDRGRFSAQVGLSWATLGRCLPHAGPRQPQNGPQEAQMAPK